MMSPPGRRIAVLRSSIDKSAMNAIYPPFGGVLIAVMVAVISTPFFVWAAESPVVVENRAAGEPTYRPPVEEEDASIMEDQYLLQLLQQDVMTLRGMVEELSHRIDQLKSVQDDRYLELDSRLQQALKPAAVEPPERHEEGAPTETIETDSTLSEKDSYDAIQSLIRSRKHDLAITRLQSMIERFPDGEHTPDAYYWLGQMYANKATPDYEKARQALAQVISYFPEHTRAPDAAYALGRVYHALGDCVRATELLTQVARQYKGRSVAILAEKDLGNLAPCGA